MAPAATAPPSAALLADPRLRATLVAVVRRYVPATDVEEIVQATFADALASSQRPEDPESLRRWIFGVARHKVGDFHRRRKREGRIFEADDGAIEERAASEADPHDAADLLRWASAEIGDHEASGRTLDWMMREGDGEKLEEIARLEALPATQVRQRVSRLRRHFKARWAALIAAALASVALVWWAVSPEARSIGDLPPLPDPYAIVRAMREEAIARCDAHDWRRCLDELDRAKAIDPKGDGAPEVQKARAAAKDAMTPPPPPPTPPSPTPSVTTSAPPSQALKPPTVTTAQPMQKFAPTKPAGTALPRMEVGGP